MQTFHRRLSVALISSFLVVFALTFLVLTLTTAAHALPMLNNAQPIPHSQSISQGSTEMHQQAQFWAAGNMRGAWRVNPSPSEGNGDIAFSGNIDLLSLDAINLDHPWIMYEQRFKTTLATPELTFHHRITSEGEATMTFDTLSFFQLLADDNRAPTADAFTLGFHQRNVTYKMIDTDVPLVLKNGPFSAWLRVTLASSEHMSTLSAVGYGTVNTDGRPDFHLQYVSREADYGLGWTVGGRAVYETPRFIFTIDAFDVTGRITWPHVVTRTGLSNSRTDVVRPDGYLSFVPLSRGVITHTTETSRPHPHLIATMRPTDPRVFTGLSVTAWGTHRLQVASHFAMSPVLSLSVGIEMPPATLSLSLEYKTWSIGISTSSIHIEQSPSIGFQLGKRW